MSNLFTIDLTFYPYTAASCSQLKSGRSYLVMHKEDGITRTEEATFLNDEFLGEGYCFTGFVKPKDIRHNFDFIESYGLARRNFWVLRNIGYWAEIPQPLIDQGEYGDDVPADEHGNNSSFWD